MKNSQLQLLNLSFKYSGINVSQDWILDDISFTIGENECCAIVGQSGSGKTTLIQHFTGLLKPTAGQVLFNNRDIWSKNYDQNTLRRKIGLVFQFPESQLFEETVEKDVAFGPKNLDLPKEKIKERVDSALQAVELDANIFGPRSPFRLSEGEKRRVAIAGVLAMEPNIIVFDEPTAGLDPKSVKRFSSIAKNLLKKKKTVVFVTHNMDFVLQLANRVIALDKGRIVFDGDPHRFFSNEEILHQANLELPTLKKAIKAWNHTVPEFLSKISTIEELEDILLKQNQ